MFEHIVIQNLIENNDYLRRFIPFIKTSLFNGNAEKTLFKELNKYFTQYNKAPDLSELSISIQNADYLDEHTFNECCSILKELDKDKGHVYNFDWLKNETEKWIRNESFRQFIIKSASALDEGKPLDSMLEDVKSVLSINFDETIGNNFRKDIKKQFEYYHRKVEKFPCNITELNNVCGGGIERKTINVLMAPTNTGKTSALISLSASYLRRGYNVLYITYEMAEEKIRQRFDANFLNKEINSIPDMEESEYVGGLNKLLETFSKNLIIKEFPTSSSNTNQIRNLLDKLKVKESFIPDIVVIDYLNLVCSTRIKDNSNSYQSIKAVAEEVRAIAVEYEICIWTATQTNRKGDGASNLNITDVSESYGLPQTTDLMIAIIQTEELFQQGRQVWKNLKDRYAGLKFHKWLVNHDFKRCMVSDCSEKVEENKKTDIESMKESNRQNEKKLGLNTENKAKNISDDFF